MAPDPSTKIDELVRRDAPPLHRCTDAVFLRRVFLDLIGTLPSAEEARAFLAKPDRPALVNKLLARDEYADYWAMKWGDILRVKSEFPMNLWPLAAQAYHRWIRTALVTNTPYDKFARGLLLSTGSNFRDAAVNFYRAVPSRTPEGMAQAAALAFMGTRTEKWPKDKRTSLGSFFCQVSFKATGEWKEEIVYVDHTKGGPSGIVMPDGTKVSLVPGQDRRSSFATWLTAANNPYFAPAFVNRVWAWLFGRGIVHESDDMRPDNPPKNPALLKHLTQTFVANGYDVKALFRVIANSSTYQQAPAPSPKPSYAHYALRRLEAEVLIDALDQVTGTTETYSSQTPEPFTFMPDNQRSIALPDGSVTSAFLDMFGRPPRDTGLESERNNKPAADQQLHLLNSSHIQRKVERGPAMAALMQGQRPTKDVVDDLYLRILSRHPSESERTTCEGHISKTTLRSDAVADLAWALLNSTEFLYRH